MAREIKSAVDTIHDRIEWIDLTRAIAILSVITVHSIERAYTFDLTFMTPLKAYIKIFCFTMFTVGRLGVPLFFFISGYLLLDRDYNDEICRKFWKRNLVTLLVTTEIWIIVYDLFRAWYDSTPLDIPTLIRNMLFLEKVNMSHYWYMPVILGLYIFLPLISAALKKFSVKTLIVPLIVAMCYLYVVPTINIFLNSFGLVTLSVQIDINFSGGAYGVMLIFGYLFRVSKERKQVHAVKNQSLIAATYWVAFVTGFILSVWIQIYAYGHDYKYNVWYTNIFLVIACLGLFGILTRVKRVPFYGVVRRIARCSFGIYLIHNMIIMVLNRDLVMNDRSAKFVVMYIIGFGLSWAIVEVIGRFKKVSKVLLYMK